MAFNLQAIIAGLGLGYNIISDVRREKREKQQRKESETAQFQYDVENLNKMAYKTFDEAMFNAWGGGADIGTLPTVEKAWKDEVGHIKKQYPSAEPILVPGAEKRKKTWSQGFFGAVKGLFGG
jgi:hypothetical protein